MKTVNQLISEIKENHEDFEWYPTTSEVVTFKSEMRKDIQHLKRTAKTEEQVAELLHCDIENIPKMSYYRSYDRRGDNKYKRYYKRIDVNNLLASRRIEIKN